MGQHGVGVQPRGLADIVLEAELDELPPGSAVRERSPPPTAVASYQIQAGDSRVVEGAPRRPVAQNRRDQTAGTVRVVEGQGVLSAGTHDEDRLVGFAPLPAL